LPGLLVLAILVLSFTPAQVSAEQVSTDNGALKLDSEYFKGYLTDSKAILTSPTRFERPEWIKASLIFAGGLTLYLFDENIKDWTREHKDSRTEDISILAEHFGDGKYLLAGLGGLFLYGENFDNYQATRTALLGLESFVISGLFTQVVKFTFHRHRPKSGDPYDTWDGPSTSSNHLSFSSGHSAVAWSVATVVATEYKDTPYVTPISYTIAALASLSRVHDDKHWASDVFIGAALGYFTSKAVISYHQNDSLKNVSFMPVMGRESISLVARYSF
jgi:membrane-associated phospholipid phosphatase